VLRELNIIAKDMLGLYGYRMEPVAWSEIFGRRARADAGERLAKPSTNVPATPAGAARTAVPGGFRTRRRA